LQVARSSKSKYYLTICPHDLAYWGFLTSSQKNNIANNINAILTDAITFTSQFLLCWVNATQSPPALTFTQQQSLPNNLQGIPALAVFNGSLYCFFQNPGNNSITYLSSTDGTTWRPGSGQIVPKSQTNGSVSVAVFNDRLFLAYRGNDNNLWCKWMGDTGWSNDVQLFSDFQLIASPTLKVFKGILYCYFVENDGLNSPLYIYTTDGVSWDSPVGMGNVYSCDMLAFCEFGNLFYCLHQDGQGSGNLLYNTSSDGQTWTSDATVASSCMSGAPALAVFGGQMYCVHEDAGGQGVLQARSTADGKTWSSPTVVPVANGTTGTAAVRIFGTNLICMNQAKGNSGILQLTTAAFKSVANGMRVRTPNGAIFLVMDYMLRGIPNPVMFNKLFRDWSTTPIINLADYTLGPLLNDEVELIRRPDGLIALHVDGVARGMRSMTVFDGYNFAMDKVTQLSYEEFAAIPLAAPLPFDE
jgi:hypothetical protein